MPRGKNRSRRGRRGSVAKSLSRNILRESGVGKTFEMSRKGKPLFKLQARQADDPEERLSLNSSGISR